MFVTQLQGLHLVPCSQCSLECVGHVRCWHNYGLKWVRTYVEPQEQVLARKLCRFCHFICLVMSFFLALGGPNWAKQMLI